jgi:thioredoxin reductase
VRVSLGGGDSALEAAASLAEADASVMLSCRGYAFQHAKLRNRQRVDAAAGGGQLKALLQSEMKAIAPERGGACVSTADSAKRVGRAAVTAAPGGR